jgi:hypothetical protein
MYVLFHAGSGGKGNFHAEFGAAHGCPSGIRESLQEIVPCGADALVRVLPKLTAGASCTTFWERFADRSIRDTACLRFLRWAQQNLADKRLWSLRHQHGYDVCHVFRLQHFGFVFSRVRTQFGVH